MKKLFLEGIQLMNMQCNNKSTIVPIVCIILYKCTIFCLILFLRNVKNENFSYEEDGQSILQK